jgi:hypothetical protein
MQGTVYSEAFKQRVPYSLTSLSGWPDERVAQTIAVMTQYAVEDSAAPEVQQDAAEALRLGDGDPVLGVWKLCKQRFKFQQDAQTSDETDLPEDVKNNIVEVVIRPLDLSLMYRQQLQPVEDCDGYSTYAASLLLALGVQCSFCTVAVDERDPSEYSHVYLVTYRNGDRIAVDASHGAYCGWECPNPFGKRAEWPVRSISKIWLIASIAALSLFAFWKGRG